jgi:hypothetical protein
MSDSNNRIRDEVAFCKEVAERIGLGCELPSKNAAVGPNGPKIKSEPVWGMVQVFDSRDQIHSPRPPLESATCNVGIFEQFFAFSKLRRINERTLSMRSIWAAKTGFLSQL